MWASYNYRRFYSYLWTIEMAKGEDKKDMIKFAKRELRDAYYCNQVSKEFFNDDEWNSFLEFIK